MARLEDVLLQWLADAVSTNWASTPPLPEGPFEIGLMALDGQEFQTVEAPGYQRQPTTLEEIQARWPLCPPYVLPPNTVNWPPIGGVAVFDQRGLLYGGTCRLPLSLS